MDLYILDNIFSLPALAAIQCCFQLSSPIGHDSSNNICTAHTSVPPLRCRFPATYLSRMSIP